MAYPTLEQLANSKDAVDTEEFGLKTEGNVELIREEQNVASFLSFKFPLLKHDLNLFNYEIPKGFGISGYKNISVPDLQDSLNNLFAGFDISSENPFVFLFRSSSKNEEPGQNKTIPVVYKGENNSQFFEKILKVLEEVRGENKIPVLVQKMVGKIEPLYISKNGTIWSAMPHQDNVPHQDHVSPYFGFYDEGFIGRSHSHMDPDEGVIVACNGLVSKLTRGTDEGAVLHFDKFGFTNIFVLGKNYSQPYHSDYYQKNADLFDVEKETISSYKIPKFRSAAISTKSHGLFYVPSNFSGHTTQISKILQYFSEKSNKQIEIEGSITSDNILNLFQLTKSNLLPQTLTKLSAITNPLAKQKNKAIGALNFVGDILIYNTQCYGSKDKALSILNDNSADNPILVISTEFPDDILKNRAEKNYVLMDDKFNFHKKFGFYSNFNTGFVDHLSAYLSSQIYKRIEKGHKTCALMDSIGSISLPLYNSDIKGQLPVNVAIIDIEHDVYFLKNTTFEAAKGNYQLFFNK